MRLMAMSGKGRLRPCDRIWQAYQERGGSEERWMFRNVITTLPNGITVSHSRRNGIWAVSRTLLGTSLSPICALH